LQGAVARAQLAKLDGVVARRCASAAALTTELGDVPGLILPRAIPGATHVYWKYPLVVDPYVIQGGADALGSALKAQGVFCAPRYIQKPAFQCEVFRDQRTFGRSRWPFTLARPEALDYSPARFPGTFEALEGILVLPWNERYTEEIVDALAEAIRAAVREARS